MKINEFIEKLENNKEVYPVTSYIPLQTKRIIARDALERNIDESDGFVNLDRTMADMYFAEVIDSGNENVWIYRFENGQGKSCYAVWCPTMDSVSVDDYVLSIDGTSATLTEFAYGEISGVSSELTVSNGSVTVDISECPVLIFSE
jgi:hypothetical protein